MYASFRYLLLKPIAEFYICLKFVPVIAFRVAHFSKYRVEVIVDVQARGSSTLGLRGRVISVWEKCEVALITYSFSFAIS